MSTGTCELGATEEVTSCGMMLLFLSPGAVQSRLWSQGAHRR